MSGCIKLRLRLRPKLYQLEIAFDKIAEFKALVHRRHLTAELHLYNRCELGPCYQQDVDRVTALRKHPLSHPLSEVVLEREPVPVLLRR